jgi:hypothetical protein
MELELLTPADHRWHAFVRYVPHDFYHLPGYVRLAAAQDGGQPEAVLITEGDSWFFLPYVIRDLAGVAKSGGHLRDISSPYGYPCPLMREARAGFLEAAIRRWVDAMRAHHTVTGFFRLHPLFPEHVEALRTFGILRQQGKTVAIDLTRSHEQIWRQVRQNHQRNIARSRQRGLTVTMACSAGAFAEFEVVYRESMERVGADEYYYFPPSYFQELHRVLGESLWTCTARRCDGDAVASILLVECGPIVQYHLGGTRTAALALAPTKLLFDHAWRWAKARGRNFLHLGGGVGCAEDSLFYFKAGFSDRHLPFCTWRVVFLDDVYRSLEARRPEEGLSTSRPEFFPSYRA